MCDPVVANSEVILDDLNPVRSRPEEVNPLGPRKRRSQRAPSPSMVKGRLTPSPSRDGLKYLSLWIQAYTSTWRRASRGVGWLADASDVTGSSSPRNRILMDDQYPVPRDPVGASGGGS